jgi:flagellar hook protein FlgE
MGRGLITFDSSGSMTNLEFTQIAEDGTESDQDTATDLSNGYFTFEGIFFSQGSTQTIELDLGTRWNGASWANSSLSTSQYASASTTTFQSANGYGAGDLEAVNVDVDGVITGSYSNGQLIPLYRVGLAKFQNTLGLFKEGGNMYSETRESGSAITNKPGTNGLGSIAPNALEQSNVDIAAELVKMITTQRGFQANSKIITVTDQMLAELINIKR